MSELDQDKDYQLLHKKYQEDATELPPVEMDKQILQAAHSAVDNSADDDIGMGVDIQPVKRAWYVPLSYVAILVLSLSVVMKLAFEPSMTEQEELESGMLLLPPLEDVSNEPVADLRRRTQDDGGQALMPKKSLHKAATSPETMGGRQQQNQAYEIGINSELAQERELKRSIITSGKSEKMARQKATQAEPSIVGAYGVDVMPAPAASVSESANDTIEMEQLKSDEAQPVTQASQINKLIRLFENEQFEDLKAALIEYRKKYPVEQEKELLPANLLEWEAENVSEGAQN